MNAVLDRLATGMRAAAGAAPDDADGDGDDRQPDDGRTAGRVRADRPLFRAAGRGRAGRLRPRGRCRGAGRSARPAIWSSPPICWSRASTFSTTIRPTASASRRWPSISPTSRRWVRSLSATSWRSPFRHRGTATSGERLAVRLRRRPGRQCRRRIGIALVGGDTVSTPGPLCLSVTALRLGRVRPGVAPRRRPDRAIPSSSRGRSATALLGLRVLQAAPADGWGGLDPLAGGSGRRALSPAGAAAGAGPGRSPVWPTPAPMSPTA